MQELVWGIREWERWARQDIIVETLPTSRGGGRTCKCHTLALESKG